MTDFPTTPPEEFNRRRRVNHLVEDLDTTIEHLGASLNELQELTGNGAALRDEMIDRFKRIQFDDDGQMSYPDAPIGGFGRVAAMTIVIDRLFNEAPKMKNPDGSVDKTQKPALECHVLLRGCPEPLYGSLSLSPEGAMKMLCPATVDNKPRLLEHHFEVDDILDIMVVREVKAEASRIVMS